MIQRNQDARRRPYLAKRSAALHMPVVRWTLLGFLLFARNACAGADGSSSTAPAPPELRPIPAAGNDGNASAQLLDNNATQGNIDAHTVDSISSEESVGSESANNSATERRIGADSTNGRATQGSAGADAVNTNASETTIGAGPLDGRATEGSVGVENGIPTKDIADGDSPDSIVTEVITGAESTDGGTADGAESAGSSASEGSESVETQDGSTTLGQSQDVQAGPLGVIRDGPAFEPAIGAISPTGDVEEVLVRRHRPRDQSDDAGGKLRPRPNQESLVQIDTAAKPALARRSVRQAAAQPRKNAIATMMPAGAIEIAYTDDAQQPEVSTSSAAPANTSTSAAVANSTTAAPASASAVEAAVATAQAPADTAAPSEAQPEDKAGKGRGWTSALFLMLSAASIVGTATYVGQPTLQQWFEKVQLYFQGDGGEQRSGTKALAKQTLAKLYRRTVMEQQQQHEADTDSDDDMPHGARGSASALPDGPLGSSQPEPRTLSKEEALALDAQKALESFRNAARGGHSDC